MQYNVVRKYVLSFGLSDPLTTPLRCLRTVMHFLLQMAMDKCTCFILFFGSCFSTAHLSEVRMHVLALLNRHSMIFGNYRWTEFDEDFLRKHVVSVAIVDIDKMATQVCYFGFLCEYFQSFISLCFQNNPKSFLFFLIQPLDLNSCSVSVHIFTLNEDGPSMLSLEDDEELSAANHWLLPAGDAGHLEDSTFNITTCSENLAVLIV